jgi:hypothetical protein
VGKGELEITLALKPRGRPSHVQPWDASIYHVWIYRAEVGNPLRFFDNYNWQTLRRFTENSDCLMYGAAGMSPRLLWV